MFEVGKKYLVTHQSGNQRSRRLSCMTYLGIDYSGGYAGGYQFDARPGAGTQTLDRSHIIAHMQVDPGTHHFMNKKIDTLTSH